MKAVITSLLDVLGILLVSGGVGALLWPWNPGVGLIAAGVFITGSSYIAARPPKGTT